MDKSNENITYIYTEKNFKSEKIYKDYVEYSNNLNIDISLLANKILKIYPEYTPNKRPLKNSNKEVVLRLISIFNNESLYTEDEILNAVKLYLYNIYKSRTLMYCKELKYFIWKNRTEDSSLIQHIEMLKKDNKLLLEVQDFNEYENKDNINDTDYLTINL